MRSSNPYDTLDMPGGSSRLHSSGSITSSRSGSNRFSGGSALQEKQKEERELEAERLWWSEASERQVKELETIFGAEFEKTTLRLKADIAGCQDRIELLVEAEKKQRHSAISDLRVEIDNQRVAIAELQKGGLGGPSGHQLRDVHELLGRLRIDYDSNQAQQAERHAAHMGNWDRQRVQLSALEASVQDLRRELAAVTEERHGHSAKVEAAMREAGDETQNLRSALMQSAEALGKGIEEVSAAVTASERKLRQELQEASAALAASEHRVRRELGDSRAGLEASLAQQVKELFEALGKNAGQLAQSVTDEREQRVLESNVLRSKLEAVCSQIENVASVGPAVPRSSVSREEMDVFSQQLQSLHELVRGERGKLAAAASEGERHTDLIAAVNQRLSAMSDRVAAVQEAAAAYERRAAVELSEERATRTSEAGELRQIAEEATRRAQQAQSAATAAAAATSEAAMGSAQGAAAAAAAAASAEATAALEEVRAELAAVRNNLHELDAACRRCSENTTRIEADTHNLEVETRRHTELIPRVEALEERARKHATAVMRVEALEADLRQVSRESDLRRLEAEVRRLAHDMAPVVQRMDAVEADVRRVSRDTSPLMARVQAVESETQRIIRDNGPMLASLEALRSEVLALKSRLFDNPKSAQSSAAAPPNSSMQQRGTPIAPSPGSDLGNSAKPMSLSQAGVTSLRRRSQSPDGHGNSLTSPAASGLDLPAPMPVFSDDIKESINSLVHKVNLTLNKQADVTSAPAQAGPCAGKSTPAADYLATSGTTTQFQALKAVQELREQNLALREGNVELYEEILAEGGNPMLAAWPPGSKPHSACATPVSHQQMLGVNLNASQPRVRAAQVSSGAVQVGSPQPVIPNTGYPVNSKSAPIRINPKAGHYAVRR